MRASVGERPRQAGWLAVILFLESAAMLVLAGWLVVSELGDEARQLVAAFFLAACAVGAAFFLLQAGRGVLDGRSWTRSATVVWQVLQMGVSFGTFNGAEGPVPLALVMFVPAIAALVLVLRKPVRPWLSREREERMDADGRP